MDISKRIQSEWNLNGKIWSISLQLEMGITLKFTETKLFLVTMDYFYTVQILLYFSNAKLTFLVCLDLVN